MGVAQEGMEVQEEAALKKMGWYGCAMSFLPIFQFCVWCNAFSKSWETFTDDHFR